MGVVKEELCLGGSGLTEHEGGLKECAAVTEHSRCSMGGVAKSNASLNDPSNCLQRERGGDVGRMQTSLGGQGSARSFLPGRRKIM